jgi:hypothetical protein
MPVFEHQIRLPDMKAIFLCVKAIHDASGKAGKQEFEANMTVDRWSVFRASSTEAIQVLPQFMKIF